MREWFKARNIWGAAITALSDDEAGRLAKAIWSFTMNGEIVELDGAGKGILAMILLTLGQDEERDNDISAKRSNAARMMHLQANADKCKQVNANASKCSNKNQNKNIDKEQESESESYIADADAHQIQQEQNRVLDAAEDAGMKMSNDVRSNLTALYAEYGLSKMLDGLKSCVEHGAVNLAYLRAVLIGKKRKPVTVLPAQQYTQRDYSSVQAELIAEQDREMEEYMKEEKGAV